MRIHVRFLVSRFVPLVAALGLAACGGGGSGGGGGVGGASTLLVTTLNDSGPGSLREAMSLVTGSPSERIAFDPALAGGTIHLDSPIILTNNVFELDGNIAGQRIEIDGQHMTRMFQVPEGLTLRLLNLVLRNGHSSGYGGAIQSDGALWIEGCMLLDNDADQGGGAISTDGTLHIHRTAFTVNTANWGGAIFVQESDRVRIHHSSFLLNSAWSGGAMHIVSADAAIVASTFHLNSATHATNGEGSAINIATNPAWGEADVRIIGCTLTDNIDVRALTAAVWAGTGGGPWIDLEIRGSLIADNDGSMAPDLNHGLNVTLTGGGNLLGIGMGGLGFQNGIDDNLVGTFGIPQTPYIGAVQTLPNGRAYRVPNAGFASHDAIPVTWHQVDPLDVWRPIFFNPPAGPVIPADQRGFIRLVGPAADYGAVERQ